MMCDKSFPCDEFVWLAEFVEYQTSEHQSKIKFAQGHKAVVKIKENKLSPQTLLSFSAERRLLRQPRSQGSLLPVPTELVRDDG